MRELANEAELGQALAWVCRVLHDHHVRFQVVGGLAVRAYGGTRPVVDIDLYAPLSNADSLLEALRPWTVWGPASYRDDSWDLRFMKMGHGPVRIEIGDSSAEPKYFDRIRRCWVMQHVDFARSNWHTVFGVEVPVMPRADLLAYKAALGREVDEIDIVQMSLADPTRDLV